MVPWGVMRPILLALYSVNQTLPSGPNVMPHGRLWRLRVLNSVMLPLGVISPIVPFFASVNQRLPCGSAAIDPGWLLGVGMGNRVMLPRPRGVVGARAKPLRLSQDKSRMMQVPVMRVLFKARLLSSLEGEWSTRLAACRTASDA